MFLLPFPRACESHYGRLSGDWPAPRPERQKDSFADDARWCRVSPRGDSMPDIQTDLIRPVPSIVPSDIPAMSDDECLIRLAEAVRDRDSARLDEVARLIGRLAVAIE
jgi:hypothetical protein